VREISDIGLWLEPCTRLPAKNQVPGTAPTTRTSDVYLRFFIVCLLIYHLNLDWPWYVVAVGLWMLDHWLPSNVLYRGQPHPPTAPRV
jgi:hypothetical protein